MVAFGWALVAAAFLGRVDLAVAVLIMGRDLWYTAEHEARHHHECGILQYMSSVPNKLRISGACSGSGAT